MFSAKRIKTPLNANNPIKAMSIRSANNVGFAAGAGVAVGAVGV